MLIEFPEFEEYLVSRDHKVLLTKGKKFFDKGRINHIQAFSGTEWDVFGISGSGIVPGYNVRIKIDEDRVIYYDCNCQGFRTMPLCKHIVAALYAIKERNLYDPNIGDYETEDTEVIDDEKDVESEPLQKDRGVLDEEIKAEESQKKRKMKRTTEEYDLIDKALECEACHELLEHPIMMPCYSHSICQSCVNQVSKKDEEDNDVVTCPKCGVTGKKEKVNITLEKIKQSVIRDRKEWQKEKENLKKEIERLKGQNKGKDKGQEVEKSKGKVSEEKDKKYMEGQESENLKNLANLSLEELKKRGESLDDISKTIENSKGKNSTSGKREKPDQIKKGQENMVDESQEGAESYDLRERKKVKTD